ncbi:MAG: hypothetical protein ABFS17_05755 [Chloroflexota bacterium]
MEDKKQVGLIVTAVSAVLCGCPGLCILVFGALAVYGGSMPDFTGESPDMAIGGGIMMICLGLILAVIPVGAGIFTYLQSKKETAVEEIVEIEEIPPAI